MSDPATVALTDDQITQLAERIAALLPGYLVRRDPPVVPVGAPETALADVAHLPGVTVAPAE
ncbi:hypothetical protein [Kitasatospora purpeofusca]|uniref:hypothetical protein n=1 Tax=Kitasatospora purpeofusca TaxID=67352 RepID=UPI003800EE35